MVKFSTHLVALVIILSLVCGTGLFAQVQLPQSGPPAAGRMIQQLRETDWILRADALKYLSKHRVSAALNPIREILADSTTQPWLRGRALIAVARIEGRPARELVLSFASHKDPHLRGAAAEAMEDLQGDDVGQALAVLLKDSANDVRYRALASVAKHDGAKAWSVVEPMTKSLDASVWQLSARALALVGNEDALRRLTTFGQRDELVAKTARGIQGVHDPKLIGSLVRILSTLGPEDERFATGMTALQHFDNADMLAGLRSTLATGNADMIRTVALIATLLVQDPELGDPLRLAVLGVEDATTIKAVLAALGPEQMKPDRHRDLFVKYLDHADVDVRALAIRCLAHCRSINLYEQLQPSVADESPLVVQAALGALRRAPIDHAPRGRLVVYLKTPLESADDEVHKMAFDLLAHAGTAEDFKPAMALLGDRLRSTDDDIRNEAAAALGSFAPLDEVESVVRIQGYPARWMILGTFLNDKENTGFNRVLPPEKKIDFEAKYRAKYVWVLNGHPKKGGEIEREIHWTKGAVDQTDGKLSIPSLVPPPASWAVAYAVADFHVEADREVMLSVDGDDAFRVWLNGTKVAEKIAEYKHRTSCVAEQHGIKISLRAGPNRFLVKTTNIDHEWWVRLRLTDTEGRPVEISP